MPYDSQEVHEVDYLTTSAEGVKTLILRRGNGDWVEVPVGGGSGVPGPTGVVDATEPATYDSVTKTVGVLLGNGLEILDGAASMAPPTTEFADLADLPAASTMRGIVAVNADSSVYWSDGTDWQVIAQPVGTYERANTVNIMDPRFGVKGGAIDTYDAFMNAGSRVLVSMGIGVTAEVGMFVAVENAGANGALWTTVESIDNDDQLTLVDAAVNAVNGGVAPIRALVAWDDTAGINLAYATGKAVEWPEGKWMHDSIIPDDAIRTRGAGPSRTFSFRKPVVLIGDVGSAAHANIYKGEGSGAPPLSDIQVAEMTFDGCGPYSLTGYNAAAIGGTRGLHQGTRGTADESLMEGVNFRWCTRLRVINVVARNCIGDGFDVDQNRDHLFLGCYADNVRIGYHTSNGTRRGRYVSCTAVYCGTGFDQSTASGHDSVENHYDHCISINAGIRNWQIAPTTPASCPGNPTGLIANVPVAPFYGTTLAKYAVNVGTDAYLVTSTVGDFTKATVGKRVRLFGAGAAGVDLDATFVTYVDGLSMRIDIPAVTTVTEAQNKFLAYGWQKGTARISGPRTFNFGVDLEDGRTPRIATTADEFRGVRPDGLYKTDFGNTLGGGLGAGSIESDEATTIYSHDDSQSAGNPRLLDIRFFGSDPEKRRVKWGAIRETASQVGFGIWTNPAGPAGSELERVHIDGLGNVDVAAQGALATTATAGFFWIPGGHGPPTGVPVDPNPTHAGRAALYQNFDNGDLYTYNFTVNTWLLYERSPYVPLAANEYNARLDVNSDPVTSETIGPVKVATVTVMTIAVAVGKYDLNSLIFYKVGSVGDIKFGFDCAGAGNVLNWTGGGLATTSSSNTGQVNKVPLSLTDRAIGGGVASDGNTASAATPTGQLIVATAGVFQMMFSRINADGATPAVLQVGTFMRLTKFE